MKKSKCCRAEVILTILPNPEPKYLCTNCGEATELIQDRYIIDQVYLEQLLRFWLPSTINAEELAEKIASSDNLVKDSDASCGVCQFADGGVCDYAGEISDSYSCSKWLKA